MVSSEYGCERNSLWKWRLTYYSSNSITQLVRIKVKKMFLCTEITILILQSFSQQIINLKSIKIFQHRINNFILLCPKRLSTKSQTVISE